MKTKYLLDAALKKYKTDTGIAKALGVEQSHISKIRRGVKPLSPYLAGRLADDLGHDAVHWALVAHRDQAKTIEEAAFWQSLLERK